MPHRGETEAQAETRRLAFETRRDQTVLDRLYEVERDTDFHTEELYHVPYYETVEEQNRFINSITNTQFGTELLRTQAKYTRDRVPMILPRFSNTRLEPITSSTIYDYTFPAVTKKEEEFLIAMDLGITYDRNGRMVAGRGKTQTFKDIVNGTFKYSTELEWIGGGQGRYQEIRTDFQRGQAYQAPVTEPAAVTITEPLLPEISFLPEAHAEHVPPEPVEVWPTLSQETKKIINDFPANLKAPDWALTYISNNINWLLEGKITETVFLTGYYDYVKKGTIILIDEPEPIVDQVSTNMIRQELLNFTIVNNRIQGSIKFIATDAFNPYYYNKEITAYLQLISNGKTIHIKSNPLRFTQTEKDELINFDEHAYDLDIINVESYARNNVDLDMSNVLEFTIEAGKEPTVAGKPGLMGAGVLGLIGILMLGGFIADHVRRKR